MNINTLSVGDMLNPYVLLKRSNSWIEICVSVLIRY